MADVLIDLGEVPTQGERPVVGRPPMSRRPAAGALSLLLIVLLGGAAPRPLPRVPVIIPARLSDVMFVDGGRLFLVGAGLQAAGSNGPQPGSGPPAKTIRSYALPSARLLSRTTVAVAGSISNVSVVGNTVLVTHHVDDEVPSTVALTEGTAEVLWRRSAVLVGASAAMGVALVNSGWGRSEPTEWSAVDLKTGAIRWSLRQPPDGFTVEAGFIGGYPRWFVTTTRSGRLEVRDARTGKVTATATASPSEIDAGPIWSVGDLALIGAGGDGLTAYALPGLTRLWHTDADFTQSWQSDCGAVICLFRQQRGMTVLDPATGRTLWDSDRWAYAEPLGPYLAAAVGEQPAGQPQLWVLDPRSGRVRGNFGTWQGLPAVDDPALRYAMHPVPDGNRLWYGLLDPAKLAVRVLGSGDGVSGDCRVGAGVMICRLVDASVAVYRLG